jgi:putative lipoic acid-binding regulatory protein
MEKKFDKATFKEKLESSGEFPMLYMFKFIVPMGREKEVGALFPKNEIVLKPSSGGKYVSTTIQVMMDSADQIIHIYERAAAIEGVIAF